VRHGGVEGLNGRVVNWSSRINGSAERPNDVLSVAKGERGGNATPTTDNREPTNGWFRPMIGFLLSVVHFSLACAFADRMAVVR
jgi:hypothetical protein